MKVSATWRQCCLPLLHVQKARKLLAIEASTYSFIFSAFSLLLSSSSSERRRIANSVPDLSVQLDVFDEQRECDESQSLQGPDGINLNSHLDVFYAILRQVSDKKVCLGWHEKKSFLTHFFVAQVADTPQEIPFLNILQHLLSIEPKDAISDIIWDTAETLVHRATLLENREDSTKLLRAPSVQKFSCTHCRSDIPSPNNRKLSLPHNLTSVTLTTPQSQPGAIPTAPPLPSGNVPPAPPSGKIFEYMKWR